MSRENVTLNTPGPVRGWGLPANSRKAHFFVDGRSLCLKWLFFGSLTHDDGTKGPDDCAACRRIRDAEIKRGIR